MALALVKQVGQNKEFKFVTLLKESLCDFLLFIIDTRKVEEVEKNKRRRKLKD